MLKLVQSNYIQILIDLTTSIRELNRADAHPMKPKDMLHLNDHLRLMMGKSSVEYFKVIYKITECNAKSKNDAIALRST